MAGIWERNSEANNSRWLMISLLMMLLWQCWLVWMQEVVVEERWSVGVVLCCESWCCVCRCCVVWKEDLRRENSGPDRESSNREDADSTNIVDKTGYAKTYSSQHKVNTIPKNINWEWFEEDLKKSWCCGCFADILMNPAEVDSSTSIY